MRPMSFPILLLACIAMGMTSTQALESYAPESAAAGHTLATADAAQKIGEGAVPSAEPATPDITINAVTRAWRDNNFAMFVQQVSGFPDRHAWAQDWDVMQKRLAGQRENGMVSPLDLMADGYLARLQTEAGTMQIVDELHASIAPKLPNLLTNAHQMLSRMASADVASSADPVLAGKAQRVSLGVQNWLDSVDFSDRTRLERALAPVAQVFRKHRLDSTHAIVSLELDAVLAIGDELMAAIKVGLGAYDVDVEPFLRALSASLRSREGNRAQIEVTIRLFDEELTAPVEMFLVEGKWMNSLDYAAHMARTTTSGDTTTAAEAAAD